MSILIKLSAAAALAAGFLLQTILPASAGEVSNRIHAQQARIHAGVRDGQISHRQARHDERRLAVVRAERKSALHRNGGVLSNRQYAHLNQRLNNNSSHIYNQRNP